jgi:hypothetical protein
MTHGRLFMGQDTSECTSSILVPGINDFKYLPIPSHTLFLAEKWNCSQIVPKLYPRGGCLISQGRRLIPSVSPSYPSQIHAPQGHEGSLRVVGRGGDHERVDECLQQYHRHCPL